MRSTRDGAICPHRILEDLGSGFILGTTLGVIGNFIRGKIKRSMVRPKKKQNSRGS